MKTIAWACVSALFMLLMIIPAFGVEYGTDFLESNNPGGWSDSLKTFEDEYPLREGGTVDVDIWITDLPEELITAGFQIEYDSSLVSVIGCDVYDGSLPGPWDGDMTTVVENPSGSGRYVVIVGNLGCVTPDAGGDIPIARVTFKGGAAPGEASVTVRPVPDFDTVVGNSATVYDPEIVLHTAVLSVAEGGQCAAEELYGEHAAETELLRNYRDRVLRETRAGQELINIYYYWSPAIVSMVEDEDLKAGIKTMLDGILPFVRCEVNKPALLR